MWAGSSSDMGEEPPPKNPDVTDLKDQFEQQQTMIAQMKETLRKNEQQLVTKEKEVEEYATKLSNIKTRSKASKRAIKGGGSKSEESEIVSKAVDKEGTKKEGEEKKMKKDEKKPEKSSSDKARQGNLILLRKKLEENRMKFEQRGKEMTENKRGIEEMVEQLRSQLDERDQTIQDLQKGLEAAQTQPPRPVEIHPRLETFVAPADHHLQELSLRDSQIVELQNQILDLQENLREKDCVIDARTRAITLMSEDMSRKSKSTLDSLDETREQMRLMQSNFVTLETSMKAEKEQLSRQLEAKEKKLHQFEESNRKLESVRYELSTRVAELQAKVVHLQSSQVEGGSLDEANKQLLKSKAQLAKKVKELTRQIDSLKKVSDGSEEVVRLQQHIAELEEDKGNLQLHLVDFDELKVSEERWRRHAEELEERSHLQNRDLDSHLHVISLLEGEKLDLLQGIQDERARSTALKVQLEDLQSHLLELENLKVSAEIKAVQLEHF